MNLPADIHATLREDADVLERIAERITVIIHVRTGLHEHFAQPIAADILDAMRRELSGERVYVPMRPRTRRRELALQLLEEYDGKNRAALCRLHRLSRRTFYRLLERGKRERRRSASFAQSGTDRPAS